MGASNRWNLCVGILSFMLVGMSNGASRTQEQALLASLFTNYTVYTPLCRPVPQDDGIVNVTIGMAIYGLPRVDLVRQLPCLSTSIEFYLEFYHLTLWKPSFWCWSCLILTSTDHPDLVAAVCASPSQMPPPATRKIPHYTRVLTESAN